MDKWQLDELKQTMKPWQIAEIDRLMKAWGSPWVARGEVGKFSGGLVSPGTLRNKDSAGTGPKRFKIGSKTGYLTYELSKWFVGRMTPLMILFFIHSFKCFC